MSRVFIAVQMILLLVGIAGTSAVAQVEPTCERLVEFERDATDTVIPPGTDISGAFLQASGINLSGISDSGTTGVFTNIQGPPGSDTDDLIPVSGINFITTLTDTSDLLDSDQGSRFLP